MTYRYDSLPVERIFLRTDNPRFSEGAVSDEKNAIEKLCAHEDILPLATDIAEIGLNPMDVAGVMKVDGDIYITGEGNRRFCAIKLLNDPERAPSNIRARIQALSNSTERDFSDVMCCIFDDRDQMNAFIRRMHSSADNGTRRKRWSSEAQEREFGTGKYALAVAINDFAKTENLYKDEQSVIDTSTLQRWAMKPAMKAMLGIAITDDGPVRFRNKKDTKRAIRALFTAMKSEKNPSRRNKDYIETRAIDIQSSLKLPPSSGEPVSLASIPRSASTSATSSVKAPRPPSIKTVAHDAELQGLLELLGYYKLASLYYSITHTKLDNNVPMITVAAWSLLECLAKADGASGDFKAHFQKEWFIQRGLAARNRDTRFRKFNLALSNISTKGNGTKHEIESGGFDKHELATDMNVLTPALKILVQELLAAKTNP